MDCCKLISFATIAVFLCFNCVTNGQRQRQTCPLYNGGIGTCTHIRKCSQALEEIRRGIYPEVCWWLGREPVVCCPSSASLKLPGDKSDKKCAEFHTLNARSFGFQERNLIKPAVVGGIDSVAKEFPHMAALGFGEKDDIQWQCGGSLISDQFVLTAAHCLHSLQFGEVKWVRLGDLNIKSTTDNAEPQDFEVVERIKHPDYKPPSQYHDIALIKLDKPATITAYVRPACLPVNADLTYTNPIATGWGRTDFSGDASAVLQKVSLEYFDNLSCRDFYSEVPARKLSNGIIDEWQLCVGSYTDEKDTCQGDSGGPLQIVNPKYMKAYDIIGITSFGKACGIANSPGVYTRVSHYVQWIEDNAFSA